MSISRVGVLFGKELRLGWRNVFFIFSVVMPVAFTIIISLVFGTVFSGKARMGLADEGASAITGRAAALASLNVRVYPSPEALRAATAQGMEDVGVVLPAGFDAQVQAGERAPLTAFVWGESTLKNRAVASAAITTLIRDLTGKEMPVEIATDIVGAEGGLPWEKRLLPIIVMMAMLMGGSVVPAALMVDEKQKRTLRAVTTTSASLGEVFAAKGALGWFLSMVMALVTLLLNRAWGPQPALLLVTLALGALMAAALGILGGAFIKDSNTLMTVVKGGGIFLYAPGLIYMFPEIPQWIARIFPTYYLIRPVIEITQESGGLASVAPELAVLVVLTAVLLALIGVVVHRAPETEGALNPA